MIEIFGLVLVSGSGLLGGVVASTHREVNRAKRRARQRGRHRAEPLSNRSGVWLGAGAITLGMGAALMTGAATAGAESGTGESSTNASSSSDAGPSVSSDTASDRSTSGRSATANASRASTTDSRVAEKDDADKVSPTDADAEAEESAKVAVQVDVTVEAEVDATVASTTDGANRRGIRKARAEATAPTEADFVSDTFGAIEQNGSPTSKGDRSPGLPAPANALLLPISVGGNAATSTTGRTAMSAMAAPSTREYRVIGDLLDDRYTAPLTAAAGRGWDQDVTYTQPYYTNQTRTFTFRTPFAEYPNATPWVVGYDPNTLKILSARPVAIGDTVVVRETDGNGHWIDDRPAYVTTVFDRAEVPNFPGLIDPTAPTAPSLSSSNVTSTSVQLTPSGGTDDVQVVGYVLYRDGAQIGPATLLTGQSYTDGALTPRTTYVYTARAVDADGKESPSSASVSVFTAVTGDPGDDGDVTPPTPPVITLLDVTATTAVLNTFNGTDDVGVVGYNIYRNGVKVNGGLVSAATPYNDGNMIPDTTYSYTSRAVDAAGNESVDSAVLSVKTLVDSGGGTPGVPPVNPEWEKNWELFNTVVSVIPGVNIASSIASLLVDAVQLGGALSGCLILGRCADVGDEFGDLAGDLIGFIPFAKTFGISQFAGDVVGEGISFWGGAFLGWYGEWV